MTDTKMQVSKVHKHMAVGAYWISYAGTWALSLLAVMAIAAPLAQVVFDFWSPKLQSVWNGGPPPAAAKPEARRGKL